MAGDPLAWSPAALFRVEAGLLIRIGLEHNFENRTLAWALDFPGCFAYGEDEAAALLRLPGRLLEFDYWVRLHGGSNWFALGNMDLHVDEVFTDYEIPGNDEPYVVNALFRHDLTPLTPEEILKAEKIFTWQHQELLAGIEFADPALLERVYPGQRWSIQGILSHLARAEMWYLQNLGFEPLQPDPQATPVDQLTQSYETVLQYLPQLADLERLNKVFEEQWTARKLVRRLLWHRRDHIDHIRQLMGIA